MRVYLVIEPLIDTRASCNCFLVSPSRAYMHSDIRCRIVPLFSYNQLNGNI